MQLVFATHNSNKLEEVRLLLPETIELLSLDDIGCREEIPETGDTLEDNARIKANHITQNYNYPCFADDTGLLVDALQGAPGVFSARYAGHEKDAEANMAKLLGKLANCQVRTARFKTVIALNMYQEKMLFEGRVEGYITTRKSGKNGFGYDPIFRPEGYDHTFAELPLTVKNKIGHRGKAIEKLIQYLSQ